MPPKKIILDDDFDPAAASKPVKSRAPRKPRAPRAKVEKPKLRTPMVVKLKLPSIKSFLSCNKKGETLESSKNNSCKSPIPDASQRKIDLANEVALAQLLKPKPGEILIPPEEPPKKRGRRRRPTVKAIQNDLESTVVEAPVQAPEAAIIAEVPKKKRVYSRQKAIDKLDTEAKSTEITNKRKADSTSTTVVKRKYVRKKPAKSTANESIIADTEHKETVTQGKLVNNVTTTHCDQSPSILNPNQAESATNTSDQNNVETASPKAIDSRKTSTSELSWTKDISSSSTTSCWTVDQNDIIRVDKKLLYVKLTSVDQARKNEEKMTVATKPVEIPKETQLIETGDEESSDSSSSSSSSSSNSGRDSESCRFKPQTPQLSVSSLSPTKTDTQSMATSVTRDEDWEYLLKRLTSEMKKLDWETLQWSSYRNGNDTDITLDPLDKTFRLLKLEHVVLDKCDEIAMSYENNNFIRKNAAVSSLRKDDTDPNSLTDRSEDDGNFTTSRSKYVMFNQNLVESPVKGAPIYNDNATEETPFDDNYDDDDALSLFAESITDMESTKFNSSANSICGNISDDEYIPPIRSLSFTSPHVYVPSKIPNEPPNIRNKPGTVCEKQNADSTSIYKDFGTKQPSLLLSRSNNDYSINTPNTGRNVPSKISLRMSHQKQPAMLITSHIPTNGVKSLVFKGVCFWNLISNCRLREQCKFPHEILSIADVRGRLVNLTNDVFIEEYMLIRNFPELRRKYGSCYIGECVERKLTRVLVEMAIDFISKAKNDYTEDADMKRHVTEKVLLYLNETDLEICQDLLQYNFGPSTLLCDMLMKTLADTQNFSRFKSVFIKLTNFTIGIGRKFQLRVTSQILERVCILPSNKDVAEAMVSMIKNTSRNIFENPLMPAFEKQLLILDAGLLEVFVLVRSEAMSSEEPMEEALSPRLNQELEPPTMRLNRQERYTSPDTTKMDAMNKPPEKIIQPSILNRIFFPPPERMQRPYRSWRGRGRPRNMMNPNGLRMSRPLMGPPMLKRHLDHRHVSYGNAPKYLRMPGPDYY